MRRYPSFQPACLRLAAMPPLAVVSRRRRLRAMRAAGWIGRGRHGRCGCGSRPPGRPYPEPTQCPSGCARPATGPAHPSGSTYRRYSGVPDDPTAARLKATVVLVHGLVIVVVAALETLGLCDGEGLDHGLVPLRVSLEHQHIVGPRSWIVSAIHFWQPRSSRVTTQPSSASVSSRAGMAVFALDQSSTHR